MSAVLQKPLGDASAFHAIFFEEADEHLSAVEGLLLAQALSPPGDTFLFGRVPGRLDRPPIPSLSV